MVKKGDIKTFIDELFPKPARKKCPSIKKIYNHIDEIWKTDLADMVDYNTSNNKRVRYIFIIIDNFSKNLWAKPL